MIKVICRIQNTKIHYLIFQETLKSCCETEYIDLLCRGYDIGYRRKGEYRCVSGIPLTLKFNVQLILAE